MKKYLKIPAIIVLDIILLIILNYTDLYKSLFFVELFSSIGKLKLPDSLKSLAILVCMSIPVLVIIYLLNLKFFKIPNKTVLYIHFGLILLISAGLELFFLVI